MDLPDANMSPQAEGSQINTQNNINEKRTDYLKWQEYFMAMAMLSAKRSKDPRCQVGACIVNEDNQIVGIGYNGMPIGCSDDVFPWGKGNFDALKNKDLYVCHAEMNAIINKNAANLKGCTLYVTRFPCNECAKIIIQSRIKKVYYLYKKKPKKYTIQASMRMLQAAAVHFEQFKPTNNNIIEINFFVDKA